VPLISSPQFWSVISALAAVYMEYLYRVLPGGWLRWSWLYVFPALLVSFSIHKLVTTPGVPLVGALVMWSICIMGSRIFVTMFVLHDKVSPGTWVAVGLMVIARFAQTFWK
jgi:hypothetical protein